MNPAPKKRKRVKYDPALLDSIREAIVEGALDRVYPDNTMCMHDQWYEPDSGTRWKDDVEAHCRRVWGEFCRVWRDARPAQFEQRVRDVARTRRQA